MKSSWSVRKLGDACEIRHGANQKSVENPNGRYPIYGSGGPIGFANEHRCPAHTVLIGRKGTLNKPILVQTPCWNIDTAYGLIPKEILHPSYLFYFCLNTDFTTLDSSSGRPSTKASSIAKISIPVPPLPEQRRIVGILDAAFEKIDAVQRNAERNLANAKELFQRVLDEEMTPKDGWGEVLLAEICNFFGRGRSKHRPRNDKSLYGGNYPFIQTGDIRQANHIITSYTQTYNQKGLEQSKLWPQGTLCITIAANIAETAILGFDACFPDSVIGCVVDDKRASVDFLEFLLQHFKHSLKAAGKGSAQDNINLGTFEKHRFPIPYEKIEQDRIVGKLNYFLESCIRLEVEYNAISKHCAELKQQILTQAFNGEL